MLFVGALGLFKSKENGITKSLALSLLLGSFYVGLVLLSSFINVCNDEELRNYLLNYWVVICGLVIWAGLWLGWELRKNKDE